MRPIPAAHEVAIERLAPPATAPEAASSPAPSSSAPSPAPSRCVFVDVMRLQGRDAAPAAVPTVAAEGRASAPSTPSLHGPPSLLLLCAAPLGAGVPHASGLTRHEQAPWPLSSSGGVPISNFRRPLQTVWRAHTSASQPCAGHASSALRDPVVAPLCAMASLSALYMRPRCDAVAMRSSRRGEWRKSHQTTGTGAAAMCYNTWPYAWPVGRRT